MSLIWNSAPPGRTPISSSDPSTRSRAVPGRRKVLVSIRNGARRTNHGFAWGIGASTTRFGFSTGQW